MGDADARAGIRAPLCMLVAACAWAMAVAGVQGRDARPQVVVRLQDAAGRPWSSAGVEVQAEGLWERLPSTWPSKPRVMLFPCSADDHITGAPRVGRVESPSRIVFEVDEGARYLAGAYGAGFDGALRAVEVPPGSGAVPIDLAARAPSEFATLAVRVAHAGGELPPGPGFELTLEDMASGAPLLARDLFREDYPFPLRIPTGSYRVVAEGKALVDSIHGYVYTPRAFGYAEAVASLGVGEERGVRLVLDDGARLEVTLAGRASDADVEAVRTGNSWLRKPGRVDELAARAASAELWLERPGRRPECVVFLELAEKGSDSEGQHQIRDWPLGAAHRSEILPSGSAVLVARLPAGRERRIELDLRAGTTTPVTLEF